jgi:hypothetical protein
MLLGVRLGGFVGMHPGLAAVTVCGVGVVRCLLVAASLVMLRRLGMMLRGVTAMH